MELVYIVAAVTAFIVLVLVGGEIRDSYKHTRAEKDEQARKAASQRAHVRKVYKALEVAPRPACRNDVSPVLQLPLNQPLLTNLDALSTCEVILDGEAHVDSLEADYRNGPAIRYRTLAELEAVAKQYAHQEWLVRFVEPLQSLVYQRHGPGQWNLVAVGKGMF